MGWTYRTFHFCIDRSCIVCPGVGSLSTSCGGGRQVHFHWRAGIFGLRHSVACSPQTVSSEGEDIVSKPRLSYGQKVVDRTVLTSQSVPPLWPRHGSLGVFWWGGATLLPDVTLAFRGQLLVALLCAAACLELLSQTLLSMPPMVLNS